MGKRSSFAVFVAVAILSALVQVGAPRAIARTKPVHPVIYVNGVETPKQALALAGQTIAATVYLFVHGANQATGAAFALDGSSIGTVSRSGKHLAPLTFDSTTVADGAHTLGTTVTIGRKTATVDTTFTVANNVPAENLIGTALTLHRIDYGTSLLYRLFSLNADGALPTQYRGTGPLQDEAEADDTMTSGSQALLTNSLPKDEADQIRPFFVRPTDPESVYAGASSGPVANAAAAADPDPCYPAGWVTQTDDSVGPGVRAWLAQKDSTFGIGRILSKAVETLNAQVPDMGNPLPDNGNGDCALAENKGNPDPRIDIYVIDAHNDYRPRGGNPPSDWPTTGLAVATKWLIDDTNNQCYGAIILNKSDVMTDDGLQAELDHEFFHLEQARYNCVTRTWFREASSEWAQVHYHPNNSVAHSVANPWFYTWQNNQPLAIDRRCAEDCDDYARWLWPLLMEQDGNAKLISDAWKAMTSASTQDAINKVLDSKFGFTQHMRDFGLRTLAAGQTYQYHEKGSTDVAKRFQDAPEFPAANPLPDRDPGAGAFRKTYVEDSSDQEVKNENNMFVPGDLTTRYLTIDLPGDEVKHFVFDFTSVPSEVDADILVKVKDDSTGIWEHRKLDSKKLEFCRNDKEDNIQQLMLVLSNHAFTGNSGNYFETFRYRASQNCGDGVQGTLNLTGSIGYDNPAGGCSVQKGNGSLGATISISDKYDPLTGVYNDHSSISGNASNSGEQKIGDFDDAGVCHYSDISWSGADPVDQPQSSVHVEDDPDKPYVNVFITVRFTGSAHYSQSKSDDSLDYWCGDPSSGDTGETVEWDPTFYQVPKPPPGESRTLTVNEAPYLVELYDGCGMPFFDEGGWPGSVTGTITVTSPKS